jgi:hypothetical protein
MGTLRDEPITDSKGDDALEREHQHVMDFGQKLIAQAATPLPGATTSADESPAEEALPAEGTGEEPQADDSGE